jgi:peptidyl-prolyl cis-trans isomerase B (cyclophilin B)
MNIIFRRVLVLFILSTILLQPAFAQQKNRSSVKKTSVKTSAISKAAIPNAAEPWRMLPAKERLVEISTDYGVMIAKLYDSTPLHRDNFIKLVQQKFYDSLLFHRVIDQFMIQGGDPASKTAPADAHLGAGSVSGDRIPSEFKSNLFHKKGALAAARDDNPDKASSNCQFYIVQGKTLGEQELQNVYNQRVKPANPSFAYTLSQKEIYNRIGGAPFLDQSYTVFGEVISGLDVIDQIAKAPKDQSDRPLQNVRMRIRLLN